MEMSSYWENEDGTSMVVKSEPVDSAPQDYDETNDNGEQAYFEQMAEQYQFKQEYVEPTEVWGNAPENYENQQLYPYEGPSASYNGSAENWDQQPDEQCFPPDPSVPGTSDIGWFADTHEQRVYPCEYCNYVGHDPKLLSSHMNNRHTKSVVYQCPHCPYNSTILKSTKDHVELKHVNEDDKPIETKRKCDFCNYSASNATALKNHMNKHTKEKQHKCSFCNFETLWEGYLKMHIRRKHSDKLTLDLKPGKEYPCQYCDYKALTPSSLKLHTNKHTREQEHQCPHCPYKTVWTTYIKLHIKNKHTNERDKAPVVKDHACTHCEYKAKNSTLLKQHMNKHTREIIHQCPHCPFSTLWLTYIKLHIKRKHPVKVERDPDQPTQDNQQPGASKPLERKEFQCQYCTYKAISSSHLKIHENKHTKAIEYKCNLCEFKTTWFGYLKLHTRRKHSNAESLNQLPARTFRCSFCPYQAMNPSTLKLHQNKHTREVLYNCPHCDFKTAWKAYIKMHVDKHTAETFKTRKQNIAQGVRSYPCEYCDYVATQTGALKQHVNSKHTRSVMYDCPKCDYRCAVMGNLKMHIRRRHGPKPDLDGKFRCKDCDYANENGVEFLRHLNEAHDIKVDMDEVGTDNIKIFNCHYCDYRTHYQQVMKKHVNKHTRQNVIKCPHCPYQTVWHHYMKIHVRRHDELKSSGRQRFTRPNTDMSRSFPCPHCDHRSMSFSSLKDHINSVHTREIFHNCPHCEHRTTLKGNLRGHIRRKHPEHFVENEKRYSCQHCDYKTSIMRNLKIHLKKEHNLDDTKVRAEDGSFQCQFCEYKAKNYYVLKVHMCKHTKERSYRCPMCEFATKWPTYLQKHIKQHSVNNRKVSCIYCDYKGCSTFRLRQHLESLHKRDTFYPCPKPNCEFKTKHYPSLRIHLKGSVHSSNNSRSVTRNFSYIYEPNEGRYFACDYCEYASKTQGNLDAHIRNKHERKMIFKCEHCSFKTPAKFYLNRHCKMKHADVAPKKEETAPVAVEETAEKEIVNDNKEEQVEQVVVKEEKQDDDEQTTSKEPVTKVTRSRRQTNPIVSYMEIESDDSSDSSITINRKRKLRNWACGNRRASKVKTEDEEKADGEVKVEEVQPEEPPKTVNLLDRRDLITEGIIKDAVITLTTVTDEVIEKWLPPAPDDDADCPNSESECHETNDLEIKRLETKEDLQQTKVEQTIKTSTDSNINSTEIEQTSNVVLDADNTSTAENATEQPSSSTLPENKILFAPLPGYVEKNRPKIPNGKLEKLVQELKQYNLHDVQIELRQTDDDVMDLTQSRVAVRKNLF